MEEKKKKTVISTASKETRSLTNEIQETNKRSCEKMRIKETSEDYEYKYFKLENKLRELFNATVGFLFASEGIRVRDPSLRGAYEKFKNRNINKLTTEKESAHVLFFKKLLETENDIKQR
jgi:hypothetical protein